MSQSFFVDLGMPKPDIDLEVGSDSDAEQTAGIMVKFEKVCLRQQPDLVIVVGDVNSTMACAITAKKLGIKVAHVEAEGHLVDAQGFQRDERGPVHRRRQTMVHDPFHRLDPQIELPADIGYRAVDPSLQDLLLERRGVRAVRVVPGAALGRGRPTRTVRTAVALGSDVDENLTTERRQVPPLDRSVEAENRSTSRPQQ